MIQKYRIKSFSSLLRNAILLGWILLCLPSAQAQTKRFEKELQNASVARLTKQYDLANQFLDSAKYYLRRTHGMSSEKAAFYHIEQARLEEAQFNYLQALKRLQQGLNRLKPQGRGDALNYNPSPSTILYDKLMVEALVLKASLYLSLSNEVPNPNEIISKGLAVVEQAIAWHQFMLNRYRWLEDATKAEKLFEEMFFVGFNLIHAKANLSGSISKEEIQNWTARYAQIQNCRAFRLRGIGESLKLGKELNQKRKAYLNTILENRAFFEELVGQKGPNNLEAVILRENIKESEDSLNLFIKQSRHLDPIYFDLAHPVWLKADDAQNYLSCIKEEGILQYLVLKNDLFCFYISPSTSKFWKLKPEQYKPALDSLVYQIKTKPTETTSVDKYAQLSFSLYKQLLGPIRTDIYQRDLWIKTSGALGNLPFEVLVTGYTASKHFGDVAFLLKSNQIKYFKHWTSFCQQRDYDQKPTAFYSFIDLKCFKEDVWDATVFSMDSLGSVATPKYEKAWLLDGYMLGDVWNEPGVNIKRDTLLLACANSPFILLSEPFNFASLTSNLQSFLVSGSYNLLFHRWSLCEDHDILTLTEDYLDDGAGKFTAVLEAKKEYSSRSDIKAHPYYWASLAYFGDDQPLMKKHTSLMKFALVLSLVTIAIFILWVVFRRRASLSLSNRRDP